MYACVRNPHTHTRIIKRTQQCVHEIRSVSSLKKATYLEEQRQLLLSERKRSRKKVWRTDGFYLTLHRALRKTRCWMCAAYRRQISLNMAFVRQRYSHVDPNESESINEWTRKKWRSRVTSSWWSYGHLCIRTSMKCCWGGINVDPAKKWRGGSNRKNLV